MVVLSKITRKAFIALILIVSFLNIIKAQDNATDYLTFMNVSYAPNEKNKFDLYVPKSATPVPLVLFFHGGGFLFGDKTNLEGQKEMMQKLLSKHIAFASVNYRFRVNNDSAGVFRSIHDAIMALQFIKHFSSRYNINKNKIACFGRSAGAGLSLYLAFHDDMAIKDSVNNLYMESTRICCAGALETQATYNMFRWKKYIPGLRIALLIQGRQLKNDIANFYGYKSYKDFKPQKYKTISNADMLAMISKDDPPIYVKNLQNFGIPKGIDHLLHHPKHAVVLEKYARKNGVKCYVYTQKTVKKNIPEKDLEAFFIENLLGE